MSQAREPLLFLQASIALQDFGSTNALWVKWYYHRSPFTMTIKCIRSGECCMESSPTISDRDMHSVVRLEMYCVLVQMDYELRIYAAHQERLP